LPKASNALPKASNALPKGPAKKLDTSWLTAAQNKKQINPFGQKKPEETKTTQPNKVSAKAQDGLFGAPINKGVSNTSSGANPFGQPKNSTNTVPVKKEEEKKVEVEVKKEVVSTT
jgi:hypothetical protein